MMVLVEFTADISSATSASILLTKLSNNLDTWLVIYTKL